MLPLLCSVKSTWFYLFFGSLYKYKQKFVLQYVLKFTLQIWTEICTLCALGYKTLLKPRIYMCMWEHQEWPKAVDLCLDHIDASRAEGLDAVVDVHHALTLGHVQHHVQNDVAAGSTCPHTGTQEGICYNTPKYTLIHHNTRPLYNIIHRITP